MFGRGDRPATPPSPSPPPADAGTAVLLSDLITAIATAIFQAVQPIRQQHIDATADLYDPVDPSDEHPERTLTPRRLAMHIPRRVTNPTAIDPPVSIPLPALVQHNPIVLDEAMFEMRCRFDGLAADGADRIALRVGLGTAGPGSQVRLNLKFRQGTVPEGVARIDDSLLRDLQ